MLDFSQINIDYLLLAAGSLLLLSVLFSKISGKLGVPSLLLFLAIGMLAGSEGIGKIYFDDPHFARAIGVIALIFILFSGALDTQWKDVKPVLGSGIALSTIGVLISTILIGLFCYSLSGFSFKESLLLGAIVSPTDAPAVFSILRAHSARVSKKLKSLIEFESASNDPMAVLLTLGLLRLISYPDTSIPMLVGMFVIQIILGIVIGTIMGKLIPFIINKINLEFRGIYPVLTIGLVLLTYGLTTSIGGNGFLAIYLAGLIMGQREFSHKKELLDFHDSLTWLMQIVIFVTLGLLVFPSKLAAVVGSDLLIAFFLILIARPVSVLASLSFNRFQVREKILISWLGLRGAVPVILATFPFEAALPKADLIFNLVFFIVLTSVLVQGTSVIFMTKMLKLKRD